MEIRSKLRNRCLVGQADGAQILHIKAKEAGGREWTSGVWRSRLCHDIRGQRRERRLWEDNQGAVLRTDLLNQSKVNLFITNLPYLDFVFILVWTPWLLMNRVDLCVFWLRVNPTLCSFTDEAGSYPRPPDFQGPTKPQVLYINWFGVISADSLDEQK